MAMLVGGLLLYLIEHPLAWRLIMGPIYMGLPVSRSARRSGRHRSTLAGVEFNRSGFNSPKLASFLIHKVYIKCLGACPEDLY